MSATFDGKVVIVTGGAQGIGRALAEHFGSAGARVVLADLDAEAGRESEAELKDAGIQCRYVETDVASPGDVQRLIDVTVTTFGSVDVICNNAGISARAAIEELDIEAFDRVLAVNLRAALLTAKCALPHMKSVGGAIVNIASTRALMSEPDSESYAASKGGLLALTHALAVSLGPYKIRVNAVSPGWIDTTNWKKRSKRRQVRLRDEDHAQHPAGRVGTPHDIARAALFLADPAADFITGQNLVIDGGMTVRMTYV